jgi:hypothetical protein
MNVIFEARMRVAAGEIDLAGRNLEVAMNKVNQPVRQVAGKKRSVVARPVLQNAACDVNARIFFIGEFNVRKRLVVAQQDVKARLILLN